MINHERIGDEQDPNDLPYRFSYSPITDEVFIIWLDHRGGISISEMFKSRKAFHRFLIEGLNSEHEWAGLPIYSAEEILKAKQGEING